MKKVKRAVKQRENGKQLQMKRGRKESCKTKRKGKELQNKARKKPEL